MKLLPPARALWLYGTAMRFLQPLVRLKLVRRAQKEPLYGQWLEERFGCYAVPSPATDIDRPLIWIHAVSLGETRAAAILLASLRKKIPSMRLLLTHGTATGRAEGQKLLKTGDLQAWQPWDTAKATAAFFQHFRPSLGLLMETEVWPMLMAQASTSNTPMALVNARMNAATARKSKRLRALSQPAYQALSHIWAQSFEDRARLLQLGALVDGVFGNLKFDSQPDADQLERSRVFKAACPRPVIVFASTREGEEVAFLNALKALPKGLRDEVQWLIVPRHPQRFDYVAQTIVAHGFPVARRGTWVSSQMGVIWLGDSVGEMPFYYGLSSMALLGGSFAPFGGQNLIEALACGCPVVTGPHTYNFAEAALLAQQAGVALSVQDIHGALEKTLGLTLHGQAQALSAQAVGFVQQHRGSAEKTAQAVTMMWQKTRFESTFATRH